MAFQLPFVMDSSAIIILGSSAASLTAVGAYSLYNKFKMGQQARGSASKTSIQQHVKHQLRLGKPMSAIKHDLLKSGHDEKTVRGLISSLELYKYVYSSMKTGHNSVRIKSALLHWGWDEARVNQAIVHASNRILLQRYEGRHITV